MDTTENRVQNLLFLLSAAPIGLGCVIVSDDVDTDVATSATSSPTSTSGETDTPTSGATEAMTSGASGDSTAGPATTEATTGVDTGGSGDTTETGVTPTGCEDYAALVAECYMDDAAGEATLNYCIEQTDYYTMYGEECLAAFDGFLACLSSLTCEELTGPDPVCEAEFDTLDSTCFPA